MSRYTDQEKSVEEARYQLLNESEESLKPVLYRSNKRSLALFIIGLTSLFVSIILSGRVLIFEREIDARCIQRHNAYSPALAALEYHDVMMNGSLDYPSKFRGPPSPELDAEWDDITLIGAFGLEEDKIENLRKEKISVLLREQSGGGYMAGLEVFHQLHCLNMLRQITWGDYYHDKEQIFSDRPEILRWHTDHCIEMLRQKLMCDADVGVITYNWVPHREIPFPNFNVWHKCRNFDKVLDWARAHEAPDTEDGFTKMPGDVEVPPP